MTLAVEEMLSRQGWLLVGVVIAAVALLVFLLALLIEYLIWRSSL